MTSSPPSAITTTTIVENDDITRHPTTHDQSSHHAEPTHHSSTQHHTDSTAQQPQHQLYVISSELFRPKPLPVRRTIVDFAFIIFAWVGLEFLLRYFGPFERGFYCNDQSIRYPYKPNTVSPKELFVYTFVMPAIAVMTVELLRLSNSRTCDEFFSTYEYGRGLPARFLVRFAIFYGYSAFAFSATALLTTVAKFSVGRLRPNFIAVCRPKGLELDNCTGLTNRYITDYECDWTHPRMSIESRLSFFSGHSSFSMCAAVFVVLYLQYRGRALVEPNLSRIPLALAQVCILSSACFIAYSRIFDYWHHWSDVLCGMIIGMLIATITALCVGHFDMKLYVSPTKYIKTVSPTGGDGLGGPQSTARTLSSPVPSL